MRGSGVAYPPMSETLSIMTDKIVYRDAVATGFHPTNRRSQHNEAGGIECPRGLFILNSWLRSS